MAEVAVVGTTSWGTTLAVLLARNGSEVLLWARSPEEAATLDEARENKRHRPGLAFPPALAITADATLLREADFVVVAVPSASLRANLGQLAPHLKPDATVLSAVKGIEPDTCLRMSEVIAAAGIDADHILALSGPNFAAEIAKGLPAATVIAGSDAERARQGQALLNGPTFRVYTSSDIVGVELGGALKNVVAIVCGLADGLGFGENAKAALITRALAEISRLGVAAGAQPMTFLGLAGIGDLVLTCGSNISRNRQMGLALAKGKTLPEALGAIDGVVEGVVTAKAAPALAERFGVELPICASLYAVLYEGKSAIEAGKELMARTAKAEF